MVAQAAEALRLDRGIQPADSPQTRRKVLPEDHLYLAAAVIMGTQLAAAVERAVPVFPQNV
jgi:hypothetical protein